DAGAALEPYPADDDRIFGYETESGRRFRRLSGQTEESHAILRHARAANKNSPRLQLSRRGLWSAQRTFNLSKASAVPCVSFAMSVGDSDIRSRNLRPSASCAYG